MFRIELKNGGVVRARNLLKDCLGNLITEGFQTHLLYPEEIDKITTRCKMSRWITRVSDGVQYERTFNYKCSIDWAKSVDTGYITGWYTQSDNGMKSDYAKSFGELKEV